MKIALVPAASGDYEFARETYYTTMRWIIERLFGWNQANKMQASHLSSGWMGRD